VQIDDTKVKASARERLEELCLVNHSSMAGSQDPEPVSAAELADCWRSLLLPRNAKPLAARFAGLSFTVSNQLVAKGKASKATQSRANQTNLLFLIRLSPPVKHRKFD
jgi:hypothetical protein